MNENPSIRYTLFPDAKQRPKNLVINTPKAAFTSRNFDQIMINGRNIPTNGMVSFTFKCHDGELPYYECRYLTPNNISNHEQPEYLDENMIGDW